MDDLQKTIQTKDGRTVVLRLDDSGETIAAETADGRQIGRMELRQVEDDHMTYYRLTWMYLDVLDSSYKRQGIGREALLFHRRTFDCPICVADDSGLKREDGSHLTGDAPGFVVRMITENILCRCDSDPTLDEG